MQTVRLLTFAPTQIARQAARPVAYHDARRFHFLCCLIPWLLVTPFTCWALWRSRTDLVERAFFDDFGGYFGTPSMESPGVLAVAADASIVLAHAVGLLLWPIMATGVVSYFYHPRRLPRALQNRAIALSYYAAGPLAMIVPVGLFVLLMAGVAALVEQDIWPEPLDLVAVAVAFIVVLLWLIRLVTLPATLLRVGLHASFGRAAACVVTTCVAWIVGLYALPIGLPLVVFYLQVSWQAARSL